MVLDGGGMRRWVTLYHARIIILVVAVLVFAAGVSANGRPRARITSDCADGTLEASPASVPLGSDGRVTFACDMSPRVPAFRVTGRAVEAEPEFANFRPPYRSLWIYSTDGAMTGLCAQRDDARRIRNDRELTIPVGEWNYCAEYVDVGPGGLPSFRVTWKPD